MKTLLKILIKAYKIAISPFLGRHCRFYPSCSTYAHQAIDHHGALKGGWLAIKRIAKCHPYYKGPAVDPVPDGPCTQKPIID